MVSDLKFALRQLAKSRGFTLVAVLALALGIGANTAIFSVVYGVLLRPLPFPDQERLLFLSQRSEQLPQMSVSYPTFVDWRERQKSFTAIGAARSQGFNYIGAGETVRITGAMATHDLFQALGVAPIRGRLFRADEDKPGAERTVLIGEALWQRMFGARETILGEKIQLSGDFYTVVGIMPARFQYPSRVNELWIPLGLFADQPAYQRWNYPGIFCVARLKTGVSYEAGVADLKAIADQLAQEHPGSNAHISVSVQLLSDRTFGQVRPALYVLLGAAGFVLLIACANVASLQLARAHARSREFALRVALGAGRGRIVRQLLGESFLLGGLGCGAGIVVGLWALDGLRSFLPANVPRMDEVSLNLPVLLFAVGASLLTSVVFGLMPALHAAKQDLSETLAQGARGGTAAGNRWQAMLIVGEFALTCVLLVGAGLMIRTLANLYHADPGYSTDRTLTVNWALPEAEKRAPAIERALERLSAIPGVKHAALITPLPLSGAGSGSVYYVEGTPIPEPGRLPHTEYFQVSGSIFSTLQIPLLAGRTFGPQDTATSPKVAIVDTRFVEKHFKGQDPLGKRFTFSGGPPKDDRDWIQIVGVVANIENYGLGQPRSEQTYVPHTQDRMMPTFVAFALRTEQDPEAIAPALRAAMREVAPDLPTFGLQTMDDLFTASVATQRLSVMLLGTFAALALLLAAVGLYGVLTYNVGQRTREIGVRMALGATQGSIVALILRHGLTLAVVGLALGLAASLGLTHLLKSVLYEVSAFDWLSFAAVACVLAAVGALACWLPARRAARVDPLVALRTE
jgi:putative ABC transport system permease protein